MLFPTHLFLLFARISAAKRHECVSTRASMTEKEKEKAGNGDVKLVGDITNEPFDQLIQ